MHPAGTKFPLREIGELRIPAPINDGIPVNVWELVVKAPPLESDNPPHEVIELAEKRLAARSAKDWTASDRLREEIAALGWVVQDEKSGYKLVRA
jgi:cysteinyl-tRNA synthetase